MPIPPDWSQDLRVFVESWDDSCDTYIGDRPFPKFVLTESADSWDHFLGWLNELRGSWCFRGQRDAQWVLNTSLDRAVRKDVSSSNVKGYYHLEREPESRELLFRFQQQAHQYIRGLPASDDLGSWFALMQHHGVPTRFLDWTKSSYVALYLAFEEEPPEEGCAVWAVDLEWLEDKARKLLPPATSAWGDFRERAEYVNGLLLGKTQEAVILPVSPLQLDARMAAQQGLFFCKLYHEVHFSLVLMRMMMHPKVSDKLDIPDRPVIRRLVLKKTLRVEFLKNLRAMNIHRASLFPGLDGFGQSLRLDLEMKVKA